MNNLKAGFGRVNINPPMGIPLRGYFKERFAEGIIDDLEINALALECDGIRLLLISIDHCGIEQEMNENLRKCASEVTGVPMEHIILSATHTHTAPFIDKYSDDELVVEYTKFVAVRIKDVSLEAVADLKEAKMGYGKGVAPNVAFIRRYIMKDGSIKTNPGVNNPDIVRPVGIIDDSVNVIRFDREGADTIVFVNFANHPDVVGGNKISADWPGLLRKNVEKILDGTKCIFFNGAQGDVNHVNVHPKDGDLNGMFIDFDDVARGYSHAEYIARVVTGGVLQTYDKVKYVEVESVVSKQKTICVPSNKPTPEELPEAHRINDLHNSGRDNELPYEGMMLSAVKIGPVAFIGIPGEPFSEIGKQIKATEGFEMIIPSCNTNGKEGYFPMRDSYDEGGYEARSSNFKAGVGEYIIKEAKKLLKSLS